MYGIMSMKRLGHFKKIRKEQSVKLLVDNNKQNWDIVVVTTLNNLFVDTAPACTVTSEEKKKRSCHFLHINDHYKTKQEHRYIQAPDAEEVCGDWQGHQQQQETKSRAMNEPKRH